MDIKPAYAPINSCDAARYILGVLRNPLRLVSRERLDAESIARTWKITAEDLIDYAYREARDV